MKDIIFDTLLDGIKLIPFLFIAFLIIELIEHRFSNKTRKAISKSGKFGPLIGSVLGSIPQCGFSVIATNLYITRIVSLGTLFSIYLSTSDEMIPLLLSANVPIFEIFKIVGIKIIIGMFFGFLIDFIYHKKLTNDFHICDDCDCEESILKSTIIHTLKTIMFILVISFAINCLFYYIDDAIIENIFLTNSFFGSFISSLIGLIPNCGASVMITSLYTSGIISYGSLIGGLLTGSGVAIMVLFKSNNHLKENIAILTGLYFIGSISGTIIDLLIKLF